MVDLNRFQQLLICGQLVAFAFVPLKSANADVGLPPAQPGSSLSPRELETDVQMVSENVQITVSTKPGKTLVEASFQMRNNGDDDELIEVWFPYGESRPESKAWNIIQVSDFQVWVDQQEVEIVVDASDEWNYIWAHWPVSFPSRADVSIQVSYHLEPEVYGPPGWFHSYLYFLETGGGWQGVIEEASITIQAPYPLQELEGFLGGPLFYAWPDGYTISGSELKWTLTDLEPTADDNIDFRLLDPEIWFAIKEAPLKLQENPDDWAAHQELARGLLIWNMAQASAVYAGLAESCPEESRLTEIAVDSYLKVLELSPPDLSTTQGALDYLFDHPEYIDPDILQAQINRALELFPYDAQLNEIYEDALADGIIREAAIQASTTPSIQPVTETASRTSTGEGSTNTEPRQPILLMLGLSLIFWAILMIFLAARHTRAD